MPVNKAFLAAAKKRSDATRAVVDASKLDTASAILPGLIAGASWMDDESVRSAISHCITRADTPALRIVCESFPHVAGSLRPGTISERLRVAAMGDAPEQMVCECLSYCLNELGAESDTQLLSGLFCCGQEAPRVLLDICCKTPAERTGFLMNSLHSLTKGIPSKKTGAAGFFIRHISEVARSGDREVLAADCHAKTFENVLACLVRLMPGPAMGDVIDASPSVLVDSLPGGGLAAPAFGTMFDRTPEQVKNSYRESFRRIQHGHPNTTLFEHALRIGDVQAAIALSERGAGNRSAITVMRQVHNPLSLLFAKSRGIPVDDAIASLPEKVAGSDEEALVLSMMGSPVPLDAPQPSKIVVSWSESFDPGLHVLLGICERRLSSRSGRTRYDKTPPPPIAPDTVDLMGPLIDAGLSDPDLALRQLRDMAEALGLPFEMINDPQSSEISAAFHDMALRASTAKSHGHAAKSHGHAAKSHGHAAKPSGRPSL